MRYPRHWSSHAVGLVATVLLHSVLFLSVSLGSWTTLVLVNLPGPNDAPMAEDIASRGAALSNSIIQIVSPDPTPSVEMPEPAFVDESGEAAYTAGDPVKHSMLFGRFAGQIDARIQRAWRKTFIGDSANRSLCRAPLVPTSAGVLGRCISRHYPEPFRIAARSVSRQAPMNLAMADAAPPVSPMPQVASVEPSNVEAAFS